MDSIGNAFAIGIGLCMIGVAIWHEWTWYLRMQHSVRLMGEIIGEYQELGELETHWKIRFEHDGVKREFISKYGGSSMLSIGDDATVILDLRTDDAEHCTPANRWLFSIAPLILGAAFVLAGVSMFY